MRRREFLTLAAGAPLAPQRPALQPVDEQGIRKLIAGFKGKVLLLDFWATWCVPCRTEMPQLVALAGRYRAKGLSFVTISCDEPEQEKGAVEFLARTRVPFPAYIKRAKSDDAFINWMDPKWSGALPALFLYDRQNRRISTFIGETETSTVEAAIRRIL